MVKRKADTIIVMDGYVVRGILYPEKAVRISDFINKPEFFIRVTDARVFDSAGSKKYAAKFLSLNKRFIKLLIPTDELAAAEKADA